MVVVQAERVAALSGGSLSLQADRLQRHFPLSSVGIPFLKLLKKVTGERNRRIGNRMGPFGDVISGLHTI